MIGRAPAVVPLVAAAAAAASSTERYDETPARHQRQPSGRYRAGQRRAEAGGRGVDCGARLGAKPGGVGAGGEVLQQYICCSTVLI